jgi:uncharacterized protein (TIRG00374 family)
MTACLPVIVSGFMAVSTGRIAWQVFRIAVAAFAVWWLLRPESTFSFAKLGESFVQLAGRQGEAITAALLWGGWSFMSAARWRTLMKVQGIDLSYGQCLRLTFIGTFFNSFMPGQTGGDVVKAYYVARGCHKPTEAVVTVFFDRALGVIALAFLIPVILAYTLTDPEWAAIPQVQVVSVVAFVLFGVIVLGLAFFISRRLRESGAFNRMLGKLPFSDTVRRVDQAVHVYRYHPAAVGQGLLWSWATHLTNMFSGYFAGAAAGLSWPLWRYLTFMPFIFVVNAVPLLPAAVGQLEAAFYSFFGEVEADPNALVMCLLYRFNMQVFWAIPGALLYLAGRDWLPEAITGPEGPAATPAPAPEPPTVAGKTGGDKMIG